MLDDRASGTGNQADDEDHQEYEEQDLRDTGRSACQAAKPQNRRNQRNNQKRECPGQHDVLLAQDSRAWLERFESHARNQRVLKAATELPPDD